MSHRFDLRVYYEDTDLAGIVYYANYLKFIERGRSEWVRELGVDQAAMKADHGLVFAVRRLEADYLRPAMFDDFLAVTTDCLSISGARIDLRQQVLHGDLVLFTALVTLVCVQDSGRAGRVPDFVRAAMRGV